MRIGVDVRGLISPTGRGVGHYGIALLSELVRTHPDDTWVLLQTGRRDFTLPPELNRDNVELHWIRRPNRLLNLMMILFGRPRLDDLTGPVDVFFAPNLGF